MTVPTSNSAEKYRAKNKETVQDMVTPQKGRLKGQSEHDPTQGTVGYKGSHHMRVGYIKGQCQQSHSTKTVRIKETVHTSTLSEHEKSVHGVGRAQSTVPTSTMRHVVFAYRYGTY